MATGNLASGTIEKTGAKGKFRLRMRQTLLWDSCCHCPVVPRWPADRSRLRLLVSA